jgi:hypothetical protein
MFNIEKGIAKEDLLNFMEHTFLSSNFRLKFNGTIITRYEDRYLEKLYSGTDGWSKLGRRLEKTKSILVSNSVYGIDIYNLLRAVKKDRHSYYQGDKEETSRMIKDLFYNHREIIIDIVTGQQESDDFFGSKEKSDRVIGKKVWKSEIEREEFLTHYSAEYIYYCLCQVSKKYRRNSITLEKDQEEKLDVIYSYFEAILRNLPVKDCYSFFCKSFVIAFETCFNSYGGTKPQRSLFRKFIKDAKYNLGRHIYLFKDNFLNMIENNSNSRNRQCDQVIVEFSNYIVKEKVSDLKEIYDIINRTSEKHGVSRYMSESLRKSKYILMAEIEPEVLSRKLLESNKGIPIEERLSIFHGYISSGKADKKFARKMRSQSSSRLSRDVLVSLFEYKDLYPNFSDLTSQFLDSKYCEVLEEVMLRGSSSDLLGLVGNKHLDQNELFRRISYKK